ncbi:class I SAM-dependent methyltransferase [Seonamhaeicola marinus]|uniref:Class I SAM-dependent methyltransferase n=1 Tax=Seonamhaeicola marinus TaxID=1912246 RepID=A0A5D0HTA2_9FLAO|nr:class I SAM-dependent methyltransferase [Seonamhaeicola marinus]TYA74613.1 class I SAM-dependent methyltransferase [Seonamhaeicola marinus]
MSKKIKTPWPTKAAMTQIYDKHLWGGNDFDFYSGEGSHKPEIIKPYLKHVISFLNAYETPLTVCDLGCGDFNIGKHIVKHTKTYTAIDIVAPLISRNTTIFKADNLEFLCLDIAKDVLPKADCVIIRQVLQHLSNNDILNISKKLIGYKYIVLTEHIPTGDFTPNKDILSGQGIRLKQNSGVDLLAPPFNLKIKKTTILTEYKLPNNKGRIVTLLYET